MSSKPTQRTVALLKREGYLCQIVERWNAFAKVRQDLFGLIDVLAIKEGEILGVQTTSGSNHATRRTKALNEPRLRAWLKAGGGFAIWSWSKRGPRGKRKLWLVNREEFTLENL